LLEQIRTIDKRRLEKRIGRLSPKQIKELNHALAVSVGLIDPKPKTMTLCLCPTCAENFFSTGAYYLKRVDPYKTEKETCTYCNQRRGFDYLVGKK
jgi:mRNA interferase MazF